MTKPKPKRRKPSELKTTSFWISKQNLERIRATGRAGTVAIVVWKRNPTALEATKFTWAESHRKAKP